MSVLMRPVLVLACVLLVAGCEARPPVSSPTTPLDRPVVPATLRNGRVEVPRTAVIQRGDVPGVFVMQDGLARFRMIRIGKSTDHHIEILSGLHGTESLVTGDLSDVHDGSPIQTR